MSYSILVTGGARSGKSQYAEMRAKQFGAFPVYIATAIAFDAEMETRIAQHQRRRGPEWHLVNAPLAMPEALLETDGRGPCLVDCLTFWLNNIMFAEMDTAQAFEQLILAIHRRTDPVILVTNEVGSGIVPENALARRFCDEAGRLNQIIAEAVDEVYVSISGIPLKLKPASGELEN